MSRSNTIIAVFGCLAIAGCSKSTEESPAAAKPAETEPVKAAASSTPTETPAASSEASTALSADIGVTAGGIQRDAKEGPAGVVSAATGTVEIRRVGEVAFAAGKPQDKLYAGDVVRTQDNASATVVLADDSVVEVGETATIGVGSRNGTADPASSAAVLSGVARFTVSARAPGEGAFRIYAPSAVVILASGATAGVGVAASGEGRVGVETGKAEVIGLVALDAQPIVVEKGMAISLATNGSIGAPAAWPADDWGTWRDGLDAKVEAQPAVDAHAAAMFELGTQLKDGYADLAASADTVATFEANAATSVGKGDTAAYEASLPDGAASIDASFALAGRVEALTWAYAGHATLASDIYVRTPTVKFEAAAPRVEAAVLWPKRFEVTAVGYFEPLRTQYYVHHPRGRAHAALVGITVPEVYAKIEPPQLDPVRVRSRVKARIWIAPDVTYHANARVVWVAPPPPDWHANVKVVVAPVRGKVAWYVRPPTLKAKVLVGVPATAKISTRLAIGAPAPRASFAAAWKVPVGVKVRIGAPDLAFAARARAGVKLDAHGRIVHAVRADVRAPDVGAKVKVKVKAPDVKIKAPDVKVGIKAKVGAGANVGANAGAVVKAKVTAPTVKVKIPAPPKPPAVKVKGKVDVKAGIKIGG